MLLTLQLILIAATSFAETNTKQQPPPATPEPSALIFKGKLVPVAAKENEKDKGGKVKSSQIVTLTETELDISEQASPDGGIFYRTIVKGTCKDAKNLLLVNESPISMKPDGSFEHPVRIDKGDQRVEFQQIDEKGSLANQLFQLKVKDFEKLEAEIKKKENKKLNIGPGISLSSVGFTQTGLSDVSKIFLTLKFGVDTRLGKSPWMAGLSAYYNFLPLTGGASNAFQFLGFNLRFGRQFPWLKAPWSISLAGGFYYLTMLTDGSFGFKNVAGPQLYPTIRKQDSNGAVWVGYFKYSPIAAGFQLLNLSNYELAIGLQYRFPPKQKGLNYGVGADFSTFKLGAVDSNGNPSNVGISSISLGASIYL